MYILSITLFLLGAIFLFLGWRWQSPSSEEALTALKGLAYLKREIILVQDQVQALDKKVQITKQVEFKEELRREELKETESKGKNILNELNAQEQRESGSRSRSELSPLSDELVMHGIDCKAKTQGDTPLKYLEVLKLAEHGQSIPEIAKHLSLSQDAVMMVLRTQQKGEIQ